MKLAELRKAKKDSQEKVASALGITLRTYQNYEYGTREPNNEMLCTLADYYGVSVDYLLGRDVPAPKTIDDMLKEAGFEKIERTFIRFYLESSEKARQELVAAIKNAVLDTDSVDDLTSDNIIIIPLHIGKVSAGDGFELPDDDTMADVECYANEHTGDANYILQVSGDSMLPKFMDGEYILVKSTQALDLGDIGVFAFRGKGYIKQYKGTYIHSLNPDYPDIHPTADSNIDILGKVLGTVEIRHK